MIIKHISEQDILDNISMSESISIVEEAFKHFQDGSSKMPSKVYLDLPEFEGDFRAMPAYEHSQEFAGVKWVNVHAKNSEIGLPTVMGTILLNNPKTAEPLAVVEATALTALRTGAASGVATKYCAKESAKTLALIGAGIQAYYQAEAIVLVRDIKVINIYDVKEKNTAILIEKLREFYKGEINNCKSVETCVKNADVVITTTPSTKPILKKSWLNKAVHINAIGADARGKRECDDAIITSAQLVIDDITQATHSGEINVPISNKLIDEKNILATLGDIITNKSSVDRDNITLFDSTGLAIQDIALAGYVYKKII